MIITNGVIITPDSQVNGKALIIEGKNIADIVDRKDVDLSGHNVIDARGGYILPGLIDIHTHGGGGSDVMDSTIEDFETILKFHASHGVTGISAATLTCPMQDILKCLELAKNIQNRKTHGSKLLGITIEGPFLSCKNRGAHEPEFLLLPSPGNYKPLLEYAGVIKLLIVAPELDGAENMIKDFVKEGVVVSGGHDASTEIEIEKAIESGMTHTTHAFCAMSTILKKNGIKHTGLCEALLLDDRLTTEIIADNKHTPPLLAKLIYKCKGPKKMCVISDSLRVAGMPSGNILYKMGPRNRKNGQVVVVYDGVAMLSDRSMFAGSITTIDEMVKNLVVDCGIGLVQAVRMASLTPAEIIHIDGHKGSIECGKDGDICIMDKDLNVKNTIVEGEPVYGF